MFRHYFYFWLTFLILLNLAPMISVVELEVQQMIAVSIALLLGIPHGAIDHVLFSANSRISLQRFVIIYLAAIGLTVFLWLVIPAATFVGFLLLSAYHFGQSQFSGEVRKSHPLNSLLYLNWGVAVLAGLIYFNVEELVDLSGSIKDMSFFVPVLQILKEPHILMVASALTVVQVVLYGKLRFITLEKLLMEFVIMVAVFIVANVFSFFIGFTLFFVGIHSLKMMMYEWDHFKVVSSQMTFRRFLIQLMPLTLVSFAGIAFLLMGVHFDLLAISTPLAILIIISSVTVPHSFVMESFFLAKRMA